MSPRIESVEVSHYLIPTDAPESDGTAIWDGTTMLVVEVHGGGKAGLGFTYGSPACGELLSGILREAVVGRAALDTPAAFREMERRLRNFGRPGVASMALSAMDVALWDLKARILDVSLSDLWGRCRESVPIYGSGGFTSYSVERLEEQLGGWVEAGISMVKMKVGSDPRADPDRVAAAREAIGEADLFVDANGAYQRKQALGLAGIFEQLGVTWFEEPVSSEDRAGLKFLRDRSPPGMRIAAGEYGYNDRSFLDLLQSDCVDVLQADVTRCGGFTGFFRASILAEAFHVPLSGHTSPSLHAVVGCSVSQLENVEYFHDHARIEELFFDNRPHRQGGFLRPDEGQKGHGLVFKRQDAEPYLK